jgi:hypothetical protein
MSYTMLRWCWCDITVLNVQGPTEDKTDMGSFYMRLVHLFDNFHKYYMNILLDFNAKAGREDIFKPTTGNESLYKISNDNAVRVVNFVTTKILTVSTS